MKLLEALQAALQEDQEKVPAGFKTAREWAKAERKSEPTIRRVLFALVQCGKVERREFRVKTGHVTRPVPHYRLK